MTKSRALRCSMRCPKFNEQEGGCEVLDATAPVGHVCPPVADRIANGLDHGLARVAQVAIWMETETQEAQDALKRLESGAA